MAGLLSGIKQVIVIDFETFYSADFSLKKLPTLLYIRSPEFLVHGAAIKENGADAVWITGRNLQEYFNKIDWTATCVVSHNALFDCTILHEKYNVIPAQYVDTLGLCRALLFSDISLDLDSVSRLLGLGAKAHGLVDVKGIKQLSESDEKTLAAYAIQDAELEYKIYAMLYPELPQTEAEVMNEVIKMSTVGILEFDKKLAAESVLEIDTYRNAVLEATNTTAEQLRSRDSFAKLLRSRGVKPPTKISPTTGKPTYAFSKNDPEFILLKDNDAVLDLVNARLAWSSNNARTRIEKLIEITSLAPYTLPVQLNYSGAHTHRLSGGGGINMMALDRGSKLRKAIQAPKDHVVMVFDLKNIELRLNMWFCEQNDLVELMTPGKYEYTSNSVEWKGADLYALEAKRQFGEVTKDTRFVGKVIQLGCGYQMGATRFKSYVATGPMGLKPTRISIEEATRIINTYRAGVPMVKQMWWYLQNVVIPMLFDETSNHILKCVTIKHEEIQLPDGLSLLYPNIRFDEDQIVYGIKSTRKLFGGKLLENLIQGLAAKVIKMCMVKIKHLDIPWTTVHQVHDELIGVVNERHAEDVMKTMVTEVFTYVPWAPGLPLRVDGGYDYCYSK